MIKAMDDGSGTAANWAVSEKLSMARPSSEPDASKSFQRIQRV
jgi:hypothetical protein